MESAAVAANDTALASQYNALRRDAYGASILAPHQQSTPDLTIYIEAGTYYIGTTKVVYAGGNSPAMVAPVSNPRIDLVTINSSGTVAVTTGSEGASPTAPTYPTDGKIVICEIYHRVGELSIKNTSDGINGYIYKDSRPFINIGNYFKSRTKGNASLRLSVNHYTGGIGMPVDFDTIDFDSNSEFDSFNITGTNTGTGTNKLIDSGASFTSAYLNRVVQNTTTGKYARITAIDSATQVTLSNISEGADIFPSSATGYRIFGSRWTAKVAGYYRVNFQLRFSSGIDQNSYAIAVYKNGTVINQSQVLVFASGANAPIVSYNDLISLAVGDYIEFYAINNEASGNTLVETPYTFFSIALESI